MTLIKQIGDPVGWVTSLYTTDTLPDELGPAAPIKAIWNDKRAGAAIPSWDNFQYEDFVGYHGWVAVEDVLSIDPYDSVFRLWGTNLVDVFNLDLTGKKASAYKGVIYTENDFSIWTEALQTKAIVVAKGTMNWVEQYHHLYDMEFTDITLPLSDDGVSINRFVTVTLLDGR